MNPKGQSFIEEDTNVAKLTQADRSRYYEIKNKLDDAKQKAFQNREEFNVKFFRY